MHHNKVGEDAADNEPKLLQESYMVAFA